MKQKLDKEDSPKKYCNIAKLPDLYTGTPLQKQKINVYKSKIPPRSCLQFKIGPSFSLHQQYDHIVRTSQKHSVFFNLTSRIDRGFDLIDNQWIGYKRNYFTLAASFQSSITDLMEFVNDSYTLELKENENLITCKIIQFGIKILSKVENSDKEINLVQHTAKRDKGPHGKPEICPVVPANLPDHDTIRNITNIKCPKKNVELEKAFYFYCKDDKRKNSNDPNIYNYLHQDNTNNIADPLYKNYPTKCIDKVAKFERIQFSCSSGIRKSNSIGRYFQLYVILGVTVEIPNTIELKETNGIEFLHMSNLNYSKKYFVNLIEIKTPPLVIRGRSPANYNNGGQQSKISISDNKIEPMFFNTNFLEESSPLKKSNKDIINGKATFDNKSNIKNIIDKNIHRDTHDLNLINTLNTKFCLSSSKMSSPTKLQTPKIPYFMNKREKTFSEHRKVSKLINIQRLEELEREISEKRQGNIIQDYPKSNFKIIPSPDKRLLQPINIKDIETKSIKYPNRENIVILGSLLYSTHFPIYNNPKYIQYHAYINDSKLKSSTNQIDKDADLSSSELNTNELSATNITFSHLYSDNPKNYKINNNSSNSKKNMDFHSSDDIFLNDTMMECKDNNISYEYNRYHSIDQSSYSDTNKDKNQQYLFPYTNDNLLLNGSQCSEETIDDLKS